MRSNDFTRAGIQELPGPASLLPKTPAHVDPVFGGHYGDHEGFKARVDSEHSFIHEWWKSPGKI
jgi:hypothetical protein